MRATLSQGGNGDNTFFYTCNVRARTRAHARVINVEHGVASVATVANARSWATNAQFETVAQTVAKTTTVATPGIQLEIAESLTSPSANSAQGAARGPP